MQLFMGWIGGRGSGGEEAVNWRGVVGKGGGWRGAEKNMPGERTGEEGAGRKEVERWEVGICCPLVAREGMGYESSSALAVDT